MESKSKAKGRIVIILIIFIMTISVLNNVFATDKKILGLTSTNGNDVYCYFSNNRCTLKQEYTNVMVIGSKTISIQGLTQANLIIPRDTNITISNDPNPTDNKNTINFLDLNSIEINQGQKLVINNNARASIDIDFNNVSIIKINQGGALVINDNKPHNFSDDLNNNFYIRYTSYDVAKTHDNKVVLHPGKLNFSNTQFIIDGNLIIDLRKDINLSKNVTTNGNDCLTNLVPFAGGLYPEPIEDNYDDIDNQSDTNTGNLEDGPFCYKYYNFDSCTDYNYPAANDANSVYLCFDVSEIEELIFGDVNASNSSNIYINSKLYVDTRQTFIRFFLDDQLTDIASTAGGDYDFKGFTNIRFNDFKGKIPRIINNDGKGELTIKTCGPIVIDSNIQQINPIPAINFLIGLPNYNVCKFLYIHPRENINKIRPNHPSGIIIAGKLIDMNKDCKYSTIRDQIFNYLLTDSNIPTTPFIFGTINTINGESNINPTFSTTGSNYGLFDVNSNGLQSPINNNVNTKGFFKIHLNPTTPKTLQVIDSYYFRFMLRGNSNYNYPDLNLIYPFKIHK